MAAPPRRGEVFRPPRHIREKVATAGGVPLAQALAQATALLGKLEGGFAAESDQTVAKLQAAFVAARAPGAGEGQRTALYDASHALRGSATTFGYPLATRVADALCKFIEARVPLDEADVAVIGVHVQALRAIFAQRLAGDGGPAGRELLPMLEKLRGRA